MRLDIYGRERHDGEPGYGAAEHYDPSSAGIPGYATLLADWKQRHGFVCVDPLIREWEESFSEDPNREAD